MTLYYVSIGTNEYQIEISDNHYKINGESIQASLVELGERGLIHAQKGLVETRAACAAAGQQRSIR